MMRRFARLLWRLMPRSLFEAMALEAPTVLDYYESHHRGVYRSWCRGEVDLGTTPASWDAEGEVPLSFTYDRFGKLEPEGVFATEDEAFEALTQHLSRGRGFVLTKETHVFRSPPDAEPPPRLLKAPAYDSDEIPY